MRRDKAPRFLLFLLLILISASYLLYPQLTNFMNILLTFLVFVVMYFQLELLGMQTSPIIDAIAIKTSEGKIKLRVANVGKYTAKDIRIVVDVKSPQKTYRYICRFFPSLPSEKAYCKNNTEFFEIRPKFWIPDSENTRIGGDIFKLMDYLVECGYGDEIVEIMINLEASNHEKLELIRGRITPKYFREYLKGSVGDMIRVVALPKNPIKKMIHLLQQRRQAKREKRGEIETYDEILYLNFCS